jgi:hypothetical protein
MSNLAIRRSLGPDGQTDRIRNGKLKSCLILAVYEGFVKFLRIGQESMVDWNMLTE